MSISKRVREQMKESSWIRRMFEEGIELRRQHGERNVFDLSLGNPLLEPPARFLDELRKIANETATGTHRYMPNPGYPETRSAIANALTAESGVQFSANEIVMTVGAAGALNVILRSILDYGDEVVILAPYFAEYVFYIQHQGGNVRVAHCNEQFMPDMASLRSSLNERTRAVIINSPNNPTGVIYSESVIAEIGASLREAESLYGTEIYLISDEPYRKLIYSDVPYPFIFEHHLRSVVATSHSKDLGLAGERIGYLAINPADPGKRDLIDASVFSLRTLGFVNAPAIMQRVVAKLQDETVDVAQYRRKRDFLYGELERIGYDCVKPEGAFYLFPKSPIPDDQQFVKMLQTKFVLTVPGIGFGTPGYFRASYCVEDWVLEGSIQGFEKAFAECVSTS